MNDLMTGTKVRNINGQLINPATQEDQSYIKDNTDLLQTLQTALNYILDRLDYGLLTDNTKRLRIVPEQATAANLNATVSLASSQTLTNLAQLGAYPAQRVAEANMDAAYGVSQMRNITF